MCSRNMVTTVPYLGRGNHGQLPRAAKFQVRQIMGLVVKGRAGAADDGRTQRRLPVNTALGN